MFAETGTTGVTAGKKGKSAVKLFVKTSAVEKIAKKRTTAEPLCAFKNSVSEGVHNCASFRNIPSICFNGHCARSPPSCNAQPRTVKLQPPSALLAD